MKIRVEAEFDAIVIYFDDLLHVFVQRSKLLAIQSWTTQPGNYAIEYVLKGGKLVTNYDERDKFVEILRQLNVVCKP